jgi:hypothetical protein
VYNQITLQHGTATSELVVLCSPPSLADLYLNHLCHCYVTYRHLADNIRDFFHNWRYHQCWSDHLHNDHPGETRLHHARKALDFHRLSGASDSLSCVCVYVKVTHGVALSLMHASFTQLLQRAVLTIRIYISTFLLLCCVVLCCAVGVVFLSDCHQSDDSRCTEIRDNPEGKNRISCQQNDR